MADKLITLSRLEQSMNKIIANINGNKPQNPLPVANGGTGAKDVQTARNNLGAAAKSHKHPSSDITGTIPVANGGTGATNAAGALNNIGAAPKSHKHPITDITGLNIPVAGTVTPKANGTAAVGTSIKFAREDHVHPSIPNPLPINMGGTNATTTSGALNNIGAAAKSHKHTSADITDIIPIEKGGTGNSYGYITTGQTDLSTIGNNATAEGTSTDASGEASHAEGDGTTASGIWSHAEGTFTFAIGDVSHVEGTNSRAEGSYSHAEGESNTGARAAYAHSGGFESSANGDYSFAHGIKVTANSRAQVVFGSYNKDIPNRAGDGRNKDAMFIIGKGDGGTSVSNCFRVGDNNVWGGTYKSSGADYAEMFEWADGNPNDEDRVGRFVTMKSGKIKYATEDDNVLGVTSAAPSVCGDTYDDQWQGMYMVDVFGRPIYEDVTIPAVIAKYSDKIIIPEHTERRQKLNPDYHPDEEYIARSSRKEWTPVGIIGKIIMLQDGSLAADDYVKPGIDGVATKSSIPTTCVVMNVIDQSHVKVYITPSFK